MKPLLAAVGLLALTLIAMTLPGRARARASASPSVPATAPTALKFTKVEKSEQEWKKILKPEQFRVLRQEGTEPAFTGALWNEHRKGTFVCAGCGLELFRSDTKFDSGTGWPSFWRAAYQNVITEHSDTSYNMVRVEVECARCGGHLGHLFDDGPAPTGLRYCINSASLTFMPAK